MLIRTKTFIFTYKKKTCIGTKTNGLVERKPN